MPEASPKSANAIALEEAIREIRLNAAERGDVVVELREASRARMEMLASALENTIKTVPADDDQFDFAISSGQNPRFFVDATSHVHLGRDRITYRFVRDGRNGRIILAESRDIKVIADRVTRHVAERIVERQRMLDGRVTDLARPSRIAERHPDGSVQDAETPFAATEPFAVPPAPPVVASAPAGDAPGDFILGLIWFLIGAVAGAALLYSWVIGAATTASGG
jgi:hypothetical protein